MLEKDTDEEYKYFRVEENPSHPTLLHLAAEQNFLHVTKLLVEKYPTLVYLETEVGDNERGYLPVEKALMCYKDETAAYLISQMKHDWWVHEDPGADILYFSYTCSRKIQEFFLILLIKYFLDLKYFFITVYFLLRITLVVFWFCWVRSEENSLVTHVSVS